MESHHHHTESSSNADDVLLVNVSLGKITVTAVCLGVVHILTGEEDKHKARHNALAALSSGRSWRAAFALGLQWGCGHSVGILSVAAICLGIGHALNLGGGFRAFCNYATGAFLIAIGLWTLYVECQDKSYYHPQLSPKSNKTSGFCGSFWPQSSQQQQEGDSQTNQKTTQQSATAASVCVGFFHGVAGPGGVLGILPVLAMQQDGDGAVILHAVVYLECFCMSSMLCMGLFAALYGEITHRVATNACRQPSATKIQSQDSDSEDKKHAAALITFRVAMASSLLSILVGIAWIVLQACGVLDRVFDFVQRARGDENDPEDADGERNAGREDADAVEARVREAAHATRDLAVRRGERTHDENRRHAERQQVRRRLGPVVEDHGGEHTQDASGARESMHRAVRERRELLRRRVLDISFAAAKAARLGQRVVAVAVAVEPVVVDHVLQLSGAQWCRLQHGSRGINSSLGVFDVLRRILLLLELHVGAQDEVVAQTPEPEADHEEADHEVAVRAEGLDVELLVERQERRRDHDEPRRVAAAPAHAELRRAPRRAGAQHDERAQVVRSREHVHDAHEQPRADDRGDRRVLQRRHRRFAHDSEGVA
ncbi:hypothetical protein FI667_g13579, partial [Globisporangium splendens]